MPEEPLNEEGLAGRSRPDSEEYQHHDDITIVLGQETATFTSVGPDLMCWAEERGFGDQLNSALGAARDFLVCVANVDPKRIDEAQVKLQAAEQEYAETIGRLRERQKGAPSTASSSPGLWLYSDPHFRGDAKWLPRGDWVTLGTFNGRARSVKVWTESVLLYSSVRFGSLFSSFGRGCYPDLGAHRPYSAIVH